MPRSPVRPRPEAQVLEVRVFSPEVGGADTAPVARESDVLAAGGLLVAIALLALAAVAPAFRTAKPPPWTTRGWIAELITLAIVCTLALGLGYLGAGALAAFQTKPEYVDLGLLAGVVLVAIVIWRGLKARGGAAGPAPAAASGPAPPPATG